MVIWSHVRDALFELDAIIRYRHLNQFMRVDWSLKKRDLISNAYSECRRYYGKKEGIYGETPLQTLESILQRIGLSEQDRFIDLGCGRGRLCFFVREVFRCSVKGVDLVPSYIEAAQKHAGKGIEFVIDDYSNHLDEKGIYFWYALNSSSREYEKIVDRFAQGAVVITISEPIKRWELLDAMPALFPWGETTAFLQRKTDERINQKKV